MTFIASFFKIFSLDLCVYEQVHVHKVDAATVMTFQFFYNSYIDGEEQNKKVAPTGD